MSNLNKLKSMSKFLLNKLTEELGEFYSALQVKLLQIKYERFITKPFEKP